MLGINYESSDEEDAAPVPETEVSPVICASEGPIATNIELLKPATVAPASKPAPAAVVEPASPAGPVNGPAQGPTTSLPPPGESLADDVPPGSPYTSNRAMIQNLTLPTVPNWDIPSSPPGSPPQRATKKFAQFLELKKKGQHFNQRLENSSVMRDPTHSQKLLEFAGISEEDQYASSLPDGLGVPTVWPEWAYAEKLNVSQKKIAEAKKEEKSKAPRGPVEFVSAKPEASSSSGTPAAKDRQQNAARKVVAGSDRQQPRRSPMQSAGKRKELEHRGGREGLASNSGPRSRSRSPKRRRSRSRDER